MVHTSNVLTKLGHLTPPQLVGCDIPHSPLQVGTCSIVPEAAARYDSVQLEALKERARLWWIVGAVPVVYPRGGICLLQPFVSVLDLRNSRDFSAVTFVVVIADHRIRGGSVFRWREASSPAREDIHSKLYYFSSQDNREDHREAHRTSKI